MFILFSYQQFHIPLVDFWVSSKGRDVRVTRNSLPVDKGIAATTKERINGDDASSVYRFTS